LKVKIKKDGRTGAVKYDKKNKSFSVDFPDDIVEVEVIDFLSKKQDFWIPESQKIDDYRIDNKYPKESEMYFSLALCTLFANTNVWVDWKTKEK